MRNLLRNQDEPPIELKVEQFDVVGEFDTLPFFNFNERHFKCGSVRGVALYRLDMSGYEEFYFTEQIRSHEDILAAKMILDAVHLNTLSKNTNEDTKINDVR